MAVGELFSVIRVNYCDQMDGKLEVLNVDAVGFEVPRWGRPRTCTWLQYIVNAAE
jgi:hypothetical protein